ncbi:adhesin [Cytobacillus sp. Hz8]|uniref:adhesin n=1 Tax=Cytobacillus sp. Hz8 TaxID=3347168 RepID=UPI0035DB19FB
MIITDEAKQLLKVFLKEEGADGLRLTLVEGCCGPKIGLTFDAPMEMDTIETINGIQVAIDRQVEDTDELTLDQEENADGVGLVLIGACNCSE